MNTTTIETAIRRYDGNTDREVQIKKIFVTFRLGECNEYGGEAYMDTVKTEDGTVLFKDCEDHDERIRRYNALQDTISEMEAEHCSIDTRVAGWARKAWDKSFEEIDDHNRPRT